MNRLKSKKNIFIIILLLVVSSTIAYLYSTDTFQNIFVAASYKVTVTEEFVSPDNWKPGDTTPKTVTLKNEGTVPIKVRVKLEESWKDSNNQNLPLQHNDENVAIINFSNKDDYIYKDGYYYYDLPLNPGETTSSIIESVTFNPNYSGTITCIENDDSTHTCSSSESGYEGGTYKLTLTIEGVQEDYYVQAWGLSGIVERKYLYNVLKKETENGRLAREYTGEHHDSFTEEPSKDIYHWYASNDSQGTQILNKNNVIFAGHCWQMIRTTDTGGVKMIYNGEALNNQCLNTRETHVGYSSRTSQALSGDYWYGTDYEYDSNTNLFSISGSTEQATWNATTGPTLIGKYTCKNTNVDGTCSTLYLVESYYNDSSAYVLPLDLNSHYSQFGKLQSNVENNLYMDVGYKYNNEYKWQNKLMTVQKRMLSNYSLSTSYWYADSISYNSTTGNYSLVNPYQVSSSEEYPNLVGKYTFTSSNRTSTNTYVYYISGVYNSTAYYFIFNSPDAQNTYYSYGDDYVDNGDGTYTITDANVIFEADWYSNYRNLNNKYICKNSVNDTCSDLMFLTDAYSTDMFYMKILDEYKYSNSFTWDGSKYILDNDTSVTFFEWNSMNKANINNAHYTCWNKTGECTTLSYIYYLTNTGHWTYTGSRVGPTLHYVSLVGGQDVAPKLNEMLYGNNSGDSLIKRGVDAWYKHYILEDYDEYIEDTIFCSDRSIYSLGGWNPDGGSTTLSLQFKANKNSKDLSCNITDRFSVSNNNAKLTYKVGLMSLQEMNLLYYDDLRNTGNDYWLMTPISFDPNYTKAFYVQGDGSISYSSNVSSYGVRPAISLKPGIEYTDGDGSMANPYIVKTG